MDNRIDLIVILMKEFCTAPDSSQEHNAKSVDASEPDALKD